MRNLLSAVVLAAFFLGCSPKKNDNQNAVESISDVIEGNEIDLKDLADSLQENVSFIDSISANGNAVSKIKSQIPQSRDELEKMRCVTTLHNGSNNAGLTIPGFGGMTLGKDETNLNVYYIETKVVINNSDSVVYGCGYSIHYLFKTVKRGLDISKLPIVAASVQLDRKKTQVYYSLQSYGMRSLNLVKYFKPTINKAFDVEGFGIVQSSIDGIQNILGDSALSRSVKFTPEIIKFVKPFQLEQ
jgi:hypothetical protein